ncbi:zinc finger, RING-CH-type containing protein [Tanacetum coccineum]
MFCDNSAALLIANEPGVQMGARHYHRSNLLKVHTDDNLAYPFTKALLKGKLTQHAKSMGLRLASSFIYVILQILRMNPPNSHDIHLNEYWISPPQEYHFMDRRHQVNLVIGILGGISYLADKHEYLRDLFKDDFNTIVIYYGTGVMVFFVLLGSVALIVIFFVVDDNGRIGCCASCDMNPLFWLVVGMTFCFNVITGGLIGVYFALHGASTLIQWILNRHNSILAKKELTKEYVVEDLHGCYTPAILDPEHLERLKALKLF